MNGSTRMSKSAPLSTRIGKARVTSAPDVAARAKRGIEAYTQAMAQNGTPMAHIIEKMADGTVAQGIGQIGLSALNPGSLACAKGCAFCCILKGEDGGTITEIEAVEMYNALSVLQDDPDGRNWTPKACPSLDPETLACRTYEARPVICRSYISTSVTACEKANKGEAATGQGTLPPYHTYLAAHGISRAALKGTKRVSTYSLFELASQAIDGASLETALARSKHSASELEAELKRSKQDLSRSR